MATKNEIYSKIQKMESEKNACYSRADTYEQKIKRLRSAYDELGGLKDEFRKTKRETEKIFDQKGKWRGEKYKKFCSAGEKLDYSYDAYYKKLDAAQDAVNTKIGELRAEASRQYGIADGLAAGIQKLWIAFQNATN